MKFRTFINNLSNQNHENDELFTVIFMNRIKNFSEMLIFLLLHNFQQK